MVLAESTRFVRADGPDKVTGSGRYTADITLTGMLTAKFLYPGVSHARITKLDVSAARQVPGVFAVLTQEDVPDVRFGSVADRTLFAKDVVRFEGEVVAAVAAIDARAARRDSMRSSSNTRSSRSSTTSRMLLATTRPWFTRAGRHTAAVMNATAMLPPLRR